MKKIFLLLFLTLTTSSVYSCDCDDKPSVEKNWDLANQVFIGEIVKVDSLLYDDYGGKLYSFTVKIKKSFKQEIYPNRDYRSILHIDTGACDFIFSVGQEYLIYAKSNDKVLNCSLCSRTDFLKNISEDEIITLNKLQKQYIKEKNEIKIIKFQNSIEYQSDLIKNSFEESLKRKNLLIYILSSITIVFLVIILILLIKRRKRIN